MKKYTIDEKMKFWKGFWAAQDNKTVKSMSEYDRLVGLPVGTIRRWINEISYDDHVNFLKEG